MEMIEIDAKYQEPLDWLESQQGAMAQLVQQWADINSGTFNGPGLAAMADQLKIAFAETGGEIQTIALSPTVLLDERGEKVSHWLGDVIQVIARPKAPLQILLCGHRDTVYEPQSSFQYCTRLSDDILGGPGVTDMKGGLVVMLYALLALERSPWASRVGWEVLINGDEEIGSPASAPILAARAPAHHLGLVFEPALSPEGVLAGERKGSGRYAVIVKGVAAHAGRNFAEGRNAIAAIAPLISAIDQMNGERVGVTINIGRIEGGSAVNVVADRAVCHIDIRTVSVGDEAWVTGKLTRLIQESVFPEGISVMLKGRFNRQPKPMTPKTEHLFQLLAETAAQLALPLSWQPCGGCCDGNNLAAAGLPTIDSLGVRGGKIHTSEEYLILSSLVERAKLTSLFLMKIASGDSIL